MMYIRFRNLCHSRASFLAVQEEADEKITECQTKKQGAKKTLDALPFDISFYLIQIALSAKPLSNSSRDL